MAVLGHLWALVVKSARFSVQHSGERWARWASHGALGGSLLFFDHSSLETLDGDVDETLAEPDQWQWQCHQLGVAGDD